MLIQNGNMPFFLSVDNISAATSKFETLDSLSLCLFKLTEFTYHSVRVDVHIGTGY